MRVLLSHPLSLQIEYACPVAATVAFVDGHRYEYFTSNAVNGGWDTAVVAASERHRCGVEGALATITTAREQELMFDQIQPFVTDWLWIGANDKAANGIV